MQKRTTRSGLIGLVIILAYFLYFSKPGLLAEFTYDDLLNSYRAWERSWLELILDNALFFRFSPTYRPMGALMYKASFEAFDFWLLPIRIACYVLFAGNFVLIYLVAKRMTESMQAGLVASLVVAYHPQFSRLYLSNGYCYDILCFFFYFLSLYCYLTGRKGWFLTSFICALNSKEMAVSLPVAILIWEALQKPPRSWKWLYREARWAMVAGLITAMYIAGRLASSSGGLLRIGGGYEVQISFSEYINHLAHYFNDMISAAGLIGPALAIGIVLGLLCLAILLKDRAMLWSWACFLVGILPVAFIEQRGLDSIYVPLGTFAIYAGQMVQRLTSFRHSERSHYVGKPMPAWGWIVFAALVFLLCREYRVPLRTEYWEEEYRAIREAREDMTAALPVIEPGAKLYFASEPFRAQFEWATLFIARLQRRDASIVVDNSYRVPHARRTDYDWVLDWDSERRRWRVQPGGSFS